MMLIQSPVLIQPECLITLEQMSQIIYPKWNCYGVIQRKCVEITLWPASKHNQVTLICRFRRSAVQQLHHKDESYAGAWILKQDFMLTSLVTSTLIVTFGGVFTLLLAHVCQTYTLTFWTKVHSLVNRWLVLRDKGWIFSHSVTEK